MAVVNCPFMVAFLLCLSQNCTVGLAHFTLFSHTAAMDLGFGGSNQKVGDITAQALIVGTKAQEAALHDELDRYDALLNDEDALSALRSKRLQEMQQEQRDKQKWLESGHGSYQELISSQDSRDVAHEFFEASKKSDRLVVHFYRPSTPLCDIFHKHLEKLAQRHIETRFVKLNVEDCDSEAGKGASFLVERLGVVIMPTLVLVHNRRAVHHIRGFDELGGTENFSSQRLAHLLSSHCVLRIRDDEDEDDGECGGDQNYGVNSINLSVRRGRI